MELHQMEPNWEMWMLVESIRRTAIIVFKSYTLYCAFRNATCIETSAIQMPQRPISYMYLTPRPSQQPIPPTPTSHPSHPPSQSTKSANSLQYSWGWSDVRSGRVERDRIGSHAARSRAALFC
ncbi:hypothetical protein J3F84DRAFT_390817 [Trichoderma pleuroticola]